MSSPTAPKNVEEWRAWLLDPTGSASDAEVLRALAARLADAKGLAPHWPLIGEIWSSPREADKEPRAKAAYRGFANLIAYSWCGKGKKQHPWQKFETLPRNIGCTPAEQKRGFRQIASAARRLEQALRNPAVGGTFADNAIGRLECLPARTPLAFVQQAAGADSALRRLYTYADGNPVVFAAGWTARPGSIGARETFFARNVSQPLLYQSCDASMRGRIHLFIADLLVELSSWEGSGKDWEPEWVRQTLRVMLKGSVRSRKKTP